MIWQICRSLVNETWQTLPHSLPTAGPDDSSDTDLVTRMPVSIPSPPIPREHQLWMPFLPACRVQIPEKSLYFSRWAEILWPPKSLRSSILSCCWRWKNTIPLLFWGSDSPLLVQMKYYCSGIVIRWCTKLAILQMPSGRRWRSVFFFVCFKEMWERNFSNGTNKTI